MTNEPNESNGQVRPDGPVDLLSLLPEELEAFAESAGLPRYRGTQIWDGLCRGAKRLEDISTLPKSAVRLLESSTVIRFAEVEEKLVSALDGTVKFLFRMTDGKAVEGVLMQ